MKRIFIPLLCATTLAACSEPDHRTAATINDLQKNDLTGEVKSMQKFEYYATMQENGELTRGEVMGGVRLLFNPSGYVTELIGYNGRREPISKTLYQLNKKNQKITAQHYNGNGEREIGPVNYEYDKAGFLISQFNYDTTGKMVNKVVYRNDGRGFPVETSVYYDNMTTLVSTSVSKYDTDGRVIETVHKVPEYGEVSSRRMKYRKEGTGTIVDTMVITDRETGTGTGTEMTVAMTYKYDQRGNWVECVTHDVEDDTYTVITREIEYYQ